MNFLSGPSFGRWCSLVSGGFKVRKWVHQGRSRYVYLPCSPCCCQLSIPRSTVHRDCPKALHWLNLQGTVPSLGKNHFLCYDLFTLLANLPRQRICRFVSTSLHSSEDTWRATDCNVLHNIAFLAIWYGGIVTHSSYHCSFEIHSPSTEQ